MIRVETLDVAGGGEDSEIYDVDKPSAAVDSGAIKGIGQGRGPKTMLILLLSIARLLHSKEQIDGNNNQEINNRDDNNEYNNDDTVDNDKEKGEGKKRRKRAMQE